MPKTKSKINRKSVGDAEFSNSKRSNYYPDLYKTGKKGNIDKNPKYKNSPNSSATPTKSKSGGEMSVQTEPARQRRMGKDVTPSGPKSKSYTKNFMNNTKQGKLK